MSARYGPATDETLRQVVNFARGMVASAELLQDTPIDEEYSLDSIPINPYLWGSDPSRGRGFLAGTLSTSEGQQPRDFRFDFAASVTPLDIFTQFQIQLPQWVEKYPGKFNEYVEQAGEDFTFLLLYSERMF